MKKILKSEDLWFSFRRKFLKLVSDPFLLQQLIPPFIVGLIHKLLNLMLPLQLGKCRNLTEAVTMVMLSELHLLQCIRLTN